MAESRAESQSEGSAPHINATGNDRPSLRDLHDHVLMKVADKWKDLGVQLLPSDQERMLCIIEANHPHDVVSCCKRVFDKWLDVTEDPRWNMLIKALNSPSVQLDYLAGQLEKMLITESAVTSTGAGPACEKWTTIQHIEVQFAKMTNRIKRALISNNIDVASLIEQLCAISAVKNKKVPLFDEDVFEKIKSIDDFWRKLRLFWNIFDYELLRYIIEISDCREAWAIFEEFLSRIDPSAIEDADLVLYCREEHQEGSLRPVLRIKVKTEKCTSIIKARVEQLVSKTHNLEKYALRFQGIKEGCIELLYYVSKPLKLYLLQFKISDRIILGEFHAHNIISLHIDEFEFINTTTWLIDSQKETTVSGQQPDYGGVVPERILFWRSGSDFSDTLLYRQQYHGVLLAATGSPLDLRHSRSLRPSIGSPSKKAKSQLNELFQKYRINASYDSTDDVTDGNVHNYRATLTYTVHGRKCRYESRGVFGRKQDAEEDAAQQALCEIEQQLKQPGGVSYKSLLKERYCDERRLSAPQYTTESTSGGFVSTVNVPQYKPVRGPVGNSKKEAEQLAAMEALRQLKI